MFAFHNSKCTNNSDTERSICVWTFVCVCYVLWVTAYSRRQLVSGITTQTLCVLYRHRHAAFGKFSQWPLQMGSERKELRFDWIFECQRNRTERDKHEETWQSWSNLLVLYRARKHAFQENLYHAHVGTSLSNQGFSAFTCMPCVHGLLTPVQLR